MTNLNLHIAAMSQDKNADSDKKACTNVQQTLRKIDSAPSVPNTPASDTDNEKKHRQIPVDLIEEESMESFPASDPPGHLRSNTNRPEPRRPGQSDN